MEYRTTSRQFRIDEGLYASQGTRFANYIIDFIIQFLLLFILSFIVGIIAYATGNMAIADYFDSMGRVAEYALGCVILLIYYNIFEIFFSRTVGKFITKTIVVDEYGEKPSSQEILLRSICRLIPFNALSFLFGPVGWHDRLSRTYVVQKEQLEERKKTFYSLDEIGNNTDAL